MPGFCGLYVRRRPTRHEIASFTSMTRLDYGNLVRPGQNGPHLADDIFHIYFLVSICLYLDLYRPAHNLSNFIGQLPFHCIGSHNQHLQLTLMMVDGSIYKYPQLVVQEH